MRIFVVTAAALVLVVAACGDSADPTVAPTVSSAPAATASAAPADTIVAVTGGDLGDHLVDGDGRTLYLFTVDIQGEASACVDDCAANWPPLVGGSSAGAGADAGLLGSVTRTDGVAQVTYNGWPLYYFAADAAPGDTNGQGVGDVWWVVSPSGDPIR